MQAGSIRPSEIAAHPIAIVTNRAPFLPGPAIAGASGILIGRALAANRLDEAERAVRVALQLASLSDADAVELVARSDAEALLFDLS